MLFLLLATLESSEERRKFEQLYYQYRSLMAYIAMGILHDSQLAEDAVQDAFLRILKNFCKVGEIDCHQTRNLLVIIVKNVSIDIYNQRRKVSEVYADDYTFDRITAVSESIEPESDLSLALDAISPQNRDILYLCYAEKCSVKELAALLGISESAVKKRLERARKALGSQLEQEGGQ
ncbi:MAG: sigma-70 family RNA polymerase sigma factor [Oscillospiraceae bacterium]|jgi:RNA polymerase sigma-70 factor (ECF subfamily)|nr:sigma-70 family RNA polymerase sigma factor [Oscillospiraceae bacterium]